MPIQRTKWSPDTCDCVLVYEWDSDVPVEERVHTGMEVIKACDIHQDSKDDPSTHYEEVKTRNRRKNSIYNKVVEDIPAKYKDADGIPVRGLEPSWDMDAAGKVKIELPNNFSTAEVTAIKTALTAFDANTDVKKSARQVSGQVLSKLS